MAQWNPIDLSVSLELKNLSHDVPEVHKIPRSPNWEALKLRKGRSCISFLGSKIVKRTDEEIERTSGSEVDRNSMA